MTSKSRHSAGDLVLIPFPFTDLSANKVRPALVITNPDRDGDFIAVAVTSKSGHAGSLSLSDTDLATGRLAVASYIRADKLFTFSVDIVRKHIGSVKPAVVQSALAVLCPVLGCK